MFSQYLLLVVVPLLLELQHELPIENNYFLHTYKGPLQHMYVVLYQIDYIFNNIIICKLHVTRNKDIFQLQQQKIIQKNKHGNNSRAQTDIITGSYDLNNPPF